MENCHERDSSDFKAIAIANGFVYDDCVSPYTVYDTKHRCSIDRFYSWREVVEYFGLDEG